MSMEIPAGKWCGKCPLCQYDSVSYLYACNHSKFRSHEVLQDELDSKKEDWHPIRCKSCLSAYPNGAVIEIKPK